MTVLKQEQPQRDGNIPQSAPTNGQNETPTPTVLDRSSYHSSGPEARTELRGAVPDGANAHPSLTLTRDAQNVQHTHEALIKEEAYDEISTSKQDLAGRFGRAPDTTEKPVLPLEQPEDIERPLLKPSLFPLTIDETKPRINKSKRFPVIERSQSSSVVTREFDPNHRSVPLYSPRALQPLSPAVSDPSILFPQIKAEREIDHGLRPHNLKIDTSKTSAGVVSPPTRPTTGPRTFSTPGHVRSPDAAVSEQKSSSQPKESAGSDQTKPKTLSHGHGALPSPIPASIPLPPLSLSTYLQLELSSHRPSQSYIYRSTSSDFPYESSRVKIERLLNFLFLPHQLEGVLWFGMLACLDCWLYTFTILPLRLLKSVYILGKSWIRNTVSEAQFVAKFVVLGSQRMWRRRRTQADPLRRSVSRANSDSKFIQEKIQRARSRSTRHHRRTKSVPSSLLPDDKADILKGLLIISTTLVLLRFDASRMYHWVRGQAAIKLYVIYNVLEVCDRLLSAIGQDVLECLFSQEALERKPDGHSKVSRPFWLFVLALGYTVIHSTALFYQVITLNVAVNSYSNALITLLMSNQFVEIKGTVFKKFEKENLFQLTCADVVERFQLWHMLIIIASRNVVETGALNIDFNPASQPLATAANSAFDANTTHGNPLRSTTSILPRSFTMLPSIVNSLGSYVPIVSQILSPFVIVLGSEMLIDWLKHAYINKFNNVRPVIYGRFLDILATDYYSNAFGDQNLTKRLGLPVIPLSCLMIRASVQTYRMFVAAWVPSPPPSAAASLASIHQQYTASRSAVPTSTAAAIAAKVDGLLYHIPSTIANSEIPSYFTTVLMISLAYLVLLVTKLILGMVLLAYSRKRYKSAREREREKNAGHHVDGSRRFGGWGVVEVDDDKRQRIYEDDPAGMRSLREREVKDSAKREQVKEKGGGVEGLEKVKRYEMVAKRIW